MITGKHVTLRAPRTSDEAALYALAADLDSWELREESPPAPLTRELFAERFTERLSAATDGAAFVIEVDGAVVGRCVRRHG